MFTVLKVLGILFGIKSIFDILRYAIIEIYYVRRGWISGIVTYGIDENGDILGNVPNRFVKLLMDSRGWEWRLGYNLAHMKWCVRPSDKEEA
jgi:hypothetical protein